MPIAYSYRRFSSEKQAKGDSLRRQTELARRFIDQNPELDLKLDEVLDLTDAGMSAYKGIHAKRGALGVFLRLVEDEHIPPGSYLLLESLDRLSREQPLDAVTLLLALVNSGIVVATVQDCKVYSIETMKGTDGTFVLMSALVSMARAHEESATKAKRVEAAWENKRKAIAEGKQLTKRVPFWINSEDRSLIADRAEVVHRIFRMAAEGLGHSAIAKNLNAEGVLAPNSTHRRGFAASEGKLERWYPSYIHKVLTSKSALGTLVTTDGKEHPGYYPPVVGEDLFNRVKVLEKTTGGLRASSKPAKPLAGLLWCVCGRRMKSESRSGRIRKDGTRNKWDYAVCSDASIGKGCVFKAAPYEQLVKKAWELLPKGPTHIGRGVASVKQRIAGQRSQLELAESEAYENFKALKTERARSEYLNAKSALDLLKAEEESIAGTLSVASAFMRKPDITSNAWWRTVLERATVDSISEKLTIQLPDGRKFTGKYS